MVHTTRCASATTSRCKCSCQHSLHGAASGSFSPEQVRRAREPILVEIEQAHRWQSARHVDRRADSIRTDALRMAQQDLAARSAAAARIVAAGLIDGDLTHEVVDAAVSALMKHDGLTGRKGRKKATSQLEFHLLCTLFWMGHQTVTTVQEALKGTVGELIESALLLPERPRTVQAAVVDGVKEELAGHLASEATAVFLEQSGLPSADQLRLLAVMFCPNSGTHHEIRHLEKEIAADFATASIEEAIQAARTEQPGHQPPDAA